MGDFLIRGMKQNLSVCVRTSFRAVKLIPRVIFQGLASTSVGQCGSGSIDDHVSQNEDDKLNGMRCWFEMLVGMMLVASDGCKKKEVVYRDTYRNGPETRGSQKEINLAVMVGCLGVSKTSTRFSPNGRRESDNFQGKEGILVPDIGTSWALSLAIRHFVLNLSEQWTVTLCFTSVVCCAVDIVDDVVALLP